VIRKQVTVGNLAAANAALLAAAQTPVSGTLLALTGSQPDAPRRVLLTFGNEAAQRTLVLTGLGWEGTPQSETLVVPSGAAGTVLSQLDYSSVTSALPGGGGWSANASLGTYAGGAAGPAQSSPWIALDPFVLPQVAIQVDVSGAINCTVQQSLDDPNGPLPGAVAMPAGAQPVAPAAMTWLNHPDVTLVGLTASVQGNYAYAPLFTRLNVNSYTAGPGNQAVFTVIQSGAPLRGNP